MFFRFLGLFLEGDEERRLSILGIIFFEKLPALTQLVLIFRRESKFHTNHSTLRKNFFTYRNLIST